MGKGIFNLENPIIVGIGKAVDVIWLGILWAICCLGIFTAGASTAALYYAITNSVREDRGYATVMFFRGFKDNFKQATCLWALWMLLTLVFAYDMYLTYQWLMAGKGIGNLLILFIVLIGWSLSWGCYLFSYIARFEDTTKRVIKNTLLMTLIHFGWSLLLLLMVLVAGFFVYWQPPLYIIAGGILLFAESLVLERVYKRYMPGEETSADEVSEVPAWEEKADVPVEGAAFAADEVSEVPAWEEKTDDGMPEKSSGDAEEESLGREK